MTSSGSPPPQSYERGRRRELDRLWLDYLQEEGVAGDGAAIGGQDAFLQGIAEFNDGRYFESHETWEEVWRQARYPESLFLLGLTKCAVGLAHRQRGNIRGARQLLSDGLRCLEPFPARYAGMDLGSFKAAIRASATSTASPPRIRAFGKRSA